MELLLELSDLSRQESLVIKACTSDSRSFEAVSATLVEHYRGVHLKGPLLRWRYLPGPPSR